MDKGQKADIYSMVHRGKVVFDNFIRDLNKQEIKKVLALLSFLKKAGPIPNTEKYRVISQSDVVELKAKPYRFLTHMVESSNKRYNFIILSCSKKPNKKQQDREILKAKKISAEIIAGNGIEITESEEK